LRGGLGGGKTPRKRRPGGESSSDALCRPGLGACSVDGFPMLSPWLQAFPPLVARLGFGRATVPQARDRANVRRLGSCGPRGFRAGVAARPARSGRPRVRHRPRASGGGWGPQSSVPSSVVVPGFGGLRAGRQRAPGRPHQERLTRRAVRWCSVLCHSAGSPCWRRLHGNHPSAR